jgi:RNA polymerase sigma-70 factor (ECF subfamily)
MLTIQPKANPHEWVERHADYLYAYTLSRISDEEHARDLVQETFLAALERLDRFEGRSAERTWLTAILKNKIIDVYRKRSRISYKRIELAEVETQFFDPDYNYWKREHWLDSLSIEQDDPLQSKELQLILQSCMQKLPPLWLAVFSMKHVDHESTSTICAELKVSDAHFWVIIHRAKINLRTCLRKSWL